MNWDALRFVLAIARHGTLQRAAGELGVVHTTAGRRLKALEERLGVRLFDRTPDGFVPTSAGDDLIAAAERMEDEVLAAESRVLGRDARLRGALRVAAADVLFLGLESAFTGFMSRYPSLDLTLTTAREPVSLPRREADVIVRLSNAPPDGLVGRKLGYVQFAAYASAALVARVGPDAPLAAYPWIGWDERKDRRWFDDWLARHAPGARFVLRLDGDMPLMAHAVRAGIGAQILPCLLADPEPGLRRIAPLDPLFRLDLWVLTLPALRTNSRVRVFMEHMTDALRAHRDALTGGAADAT